MLFFVQQEFANEFQDIEGEMLVTKLGYMVLQGKAVVMPSSSGNVLEKYADDPKYKPVLLDMNDLHNGIS